MNDGHVGSPRKALEKPHQVMGSIFTDLDRWWELNIFQAMDLNI
jgi:hypothetical protein